MLARAARPPDRLRDADATVVGAAFGSLIETFLKAGGVNVEAQDLGRKGLLSGEVFRAADALLPGGWGHRAIMAHCRWVGNCFQPYSFSGIDGRASQEYSFCKFEVAARPRGDVAVDSDNQDSEIEALEVWIQKSGGSGFFDLVRFRY